VNVKASKRKIDPFARRVQQAIRLLNRKWVVPILWDMRDHPRRPFQLANLVGAKDKVIDDTMRYAIRAGLVDYTLIKDGDRAAKAYELTDLGRQSLDLFVVIHDWAEDHLPPPGDDADGHDHDDDVIVLED
jgi:DNA-binding HxlR family transcriptional regulator